MGDHRNNSSDSRAWTRCPKRYIIGKVQLRWWPVNHARFFEDECIAKDGGQREVGTNQGPAVFKTSLTQASRDMGDTSATKLLEASDAVARADTHGPAKNFVRDHRTGCWTVSELCAQYGISRQTGYEVLARVHAEGEAGLASTLAATASQPRGHGPGRSRGGARGARPVSLLGRSRVAQWLIDHHPAIDWPSRITIHRICQRAQLVRRPRPRRPRAAPGGPLRAAPIPNGVWTIDFKGDFRLGNGERCYPLTLRDVASRFTLRIDAFAEPDGRHTQARLPRAFHDYGLPACLRSDNGPPFAGPGLAGLSQLGVWCLKLGIALEHIAPGHPEQNGSHEHFHGVLKVQTAQPPARTRPGQQRRFDRFRHEYNDERPHQALGDTVPARHYTPSWRRWDGRVPRIDYPRHWEPCRVQPNGRIRFRGASIFLSRALANEWVALEEHADALWTVHFATVPLARWLERRNRLRPLTLAGGQS